MNLTNKYKIEQLPYEEMPSRFMCRWHLSHLGHSQHISQRYERKHNLIRPSFHMTCHLCNAPRKTARPSLTYKTASKLAQKTQAIHGSPYLKLLHRRPEIPRRSPFHQWGVKQKRARGSKRENHDETVSRGFRIQFWIERRLLCAITQPLPVLIAWNKKSLIVLYQVYTPLHISYPFSRNSIAETV